MPQIKRRRAAWLSAVFAVARRVRRVNSYVVPAFSPCPPRDRVNSYVVPATPAV